MLFLPPEIILHVTVYLRIQDIESLAQTFNCVITPVCLDVLSDWLAVSRNERTMIALFNTNSTSYDRNEGMRKTFDREQGKLGVFSPPPEMPASQLRLLEYLELSGQFDWLQQLDHLSYERLWLPPPTEPAATMEQMATLQNATQRLGLVLPSEFAVFMTSLHLQRRFRRRRQAICTEVFSLEPLFKVTSKKSITLSSGIKATINGYMCKFLEEDWSNDQLGLTELGLRWYLYLSCDGGHCVLSSDADLFRSPQDMDNTVTLIGADLKHGEQPIEGRDALSSIERDVGLTTILDFDEFRAKEHMLGSIYLEASSFEAFLVHDYFSEWLCAIQHGKLDVDDAPIHVREFMFRIYTEEGRKQWP